MMPNGTEVNMQNVIDKRTYTVSEIAALLGISRKSAYALVKSGQFSYIRAGRMIRVSKVSFDKWLNP